MLSLDPCLPPPPPPDSILYLPAPPLLHLLLSLLSHCYSYPYSYSPFPTSKHLSHAHAHAARTCPSMYVCMYVCIPVLPYAYSYPLQSTAPDPVILFPRRPGLACSCLYPPQNVKY
ncbi:hypothetical protein B0H17DRAFT_1052714 [Mycena rosella]|uniref:Uncharacterized protein n=1 Tax=Mycena rosella TaxID=1033263 RepID=A0AAD7GMY8_MYCRO|nr:hypothetical protein B0H17DRAFT_1052714 [Mycena rosella]